MIRSRRGHPAERIALAVDNHGTRALEANEQADRVLGEHVFRHGQPAGLDMIS